MTDAQTILAVDEDPALPELIERHFRAGAIVLAAASAGEALRLASERPIDVVVSELRLPDRSGLDLLADLREHAPDVVAILVSSRAGPDELLGAINEGRLYRFVRKPLQDAELVMTVTNALEAAALRREREQLLERLSRRLDALSILYEVSTSAAAPRTHAELVDVLTRALHRVVRFDVAASLLATDERRPVMHVHATSPCDETTLVHVRDRTVELLSTLTGRELGGRELRLDISGERLPPGLVRTLQSTTHIPLIADGRTIGIIYLGAFRPQAFTPDDERLLYVLANQTSMAVRRLERRILEERRKMALMVESMADGVIMTDESGEVCQCNPAARRMLAIDPHVEVTTQYLKDRLGFYPFDLVRGQSDPARAGGGPALVREEVRIGDTFLHSIVSPVRSGKDTIGVVVVLRDITERKGLEERKEEFVSAVSHELRTPLTTITGALDITLNNYPQALGGKARRYVEMAREGCSRLGAIIDDLLDVAKLERGKVPLRPEPLLFDALCKAAIEKFRLTIDAKKIALRLDVERPDLRIVADADRLTQVLGNLLSNALKFTPEGGHVQIEVFGPDTASTHVGLSVWNDGEPIPDDAQERVFDKFETVPPAGNVGRRVGGTGLGLAISRSIVEAHGGRIWVEPVRVGAKFVLALPVAPPEETTPAPGAASDEGSLALVLSDRPRTAALLKGILLASGRQTHVESSADGGLAFARDHRPHLVVLDTELGRSEALALVEILKHDPETKGIPLLAVGAPGQLDLARTREVDGTLALPVDGETFAAICERLCAERGAEAPRRILVADDDASIRMICREVLEQAGYRVEEAADGQQAVEASLRSQPDLIVLDVMMPELDGYQVARRLKSEQATAQLPIIFLSARGQTADKVRAFKTGAEDYLVKPFDHAELVMRIEKALERRAREASASPTTRLPGSAAIEGEIVRRLASADDYAFCYVDLDNLKSFNDYYGYAKADGVIRQTGDILREVILREGNPDDFVGHIAGDDFVLVTTSDRVDRVCRTLIETFDRLIPLYYNRVDRERGFIETTDRYGTLRKFPMMSISVAVLSMRALEPRDSATLARLAALEKAKAKALGGSSYVRDGQVLWPLPPRPQLTPAEPRGAPSAAERPS
jgi:PAS domain S-box-containing protein